MGAFVAPAMSSHRELLVRPTVRPMSSTEVADARAARDFERSQRDHAKIKDAAVAHRAATAGTSQRMNSWAASKSPSQAAFESRKSKASRTKEPSSVERVRNARTNYAEVKKSEDFDRQKQLDLKVKESQRGVAGEKNESSASKRVQERSWEDAIAQSRTEGRKQALLKSAVGPASRRAEIEDESTHRTYGHLTKAELADYGMIEGETLDAEGRVIPPWVGRAERYAGPEGENEVRYPFDYGYGARGQFEASRGKMPPPQLFLKDKSAKPRRDPDLHDPMFPYVPYGSDPAMAIHPGFARPEEVSALAYERAGYGFGYGRPAMPMYSHPAYGPCVPY